MARLREPSWKASFPSSQQWVISRWSKPKMLQVTSISTMERQYVGSCDIRGMVDAFGIQRSHAILMQIWVEHNKRQGSNCNVMLISPHEFPAGDQNQQLDLVKALADHCS